jgi:hypothetical protein
VTLYVARNPGCSYEEIGNGVGLRSKGTVFTHVRRLRALGILRGDAGHVRTLQLGRDIVVSDKGSIGWIARMEGFREVHDDEETTSATSP